MKHNVLAENGMESEVRENASAILNDRPPFIKIDANWWIFIFICVSLIFFVSCDRSIDNRKA